MSCPCQSCGASAPTVSSPMGGGAGKANGSSPPLGPLEQYTLTRDPAFVSPSGSSAVRAERLFNRGWGIVVAVLAVFGGIKVAGSVFR